MNVKEYISSGIVESYVLGLLTEAERQEFESLCNSYPEIVAARNAFELALEQQLMKDARQAPLHLEKQIEERLANASSEKNTVEFNEEKTPVRNIGLWKWLAAASLILLAGSIYWIVRTQNRNESLLVQNNELQNRLRRSNAELTAMNQEKDMLVKPGMKMAALKGTANAPQALATVFWDTTSADRDVYLMINNLPQPASDKQYQLWALLNKKPIDLGVFDMDIRQKHLLVKMKNVQNAQAFAITLEPRGGSVNPSMDSMYVMGTL